MSLKHCRFEIAHQLSLMETVQKARLLEQTMVKYQRSGDRRMPNLKSN